MPKHKGFRRKTRNFLSAKRPRGLTRMLEDYSPGDKVVVDVDPSQQKGMPHRRYQGRVGVVKEVRRRSLILEVDISSRKSKLLIARLEHVRPLGG